MAVILGLAGTLAITGGAHGASGVDDAALASASVAYLQARAADWGIRQADQEFRLRQVVRDGLGQAHVRLDQLHQGVPVFGRQLIVHFDGSGSPRAITGAYLAGLSVTTQPVISAQDAQAAVRRQFPGPLLNPPAVDLVLYPANGGAQLAYRVVLADDETPRRVVSFVDAMTGAVLHSYNDLRSLRPTPMWPTAAGTTQTAGDQAQASVTASATGVGNSLYSGAVSLTTNQVGPVYTLKDGARGNLKTNDMRNRTSGLALPFVDADNVWGDGTTGNRASAAVDAHFGAEMTWDYYLNVHGRNGIYDDGAGSLSRVHYGTSYNNAFWSDACQCMTYGDGDGSFFSPLTAIDVAGHEMTHGVTSATAGLIYDNQSGGLNEAMSDIFGTMVEFYAASIGGGDISPDYLIGEDIYTPATPGDALRYMANPKQDGHSIDNFSQYNDAIDVHYTSGIANVVFYLLAEGGRHPTTGMPVAGIGRSAAERIFFRALTVYMIPSETFSQARADTIQAADDLFLPGSAESLAVAQAWSSALVQ